MSSELGLTDQLQLDPGVPGGRDLVVHPAPVLPTVLPHQPLDGEVGLAVPRSLLVVDEASVAQPWVLPVVAGA